MRQPPQEIQLAFDIAKSFLRGKEDLQVAKLEEIANEGATQMSQEGGVWDEEVYDENDNDCADPSWYLVGAETVRVSVDFKGRGLRGVERT